MRRVVQGRTGEREESLWRRSGRPLSVFSSALVLVSVASLVPLSVWFCGGCAALVGDEEWVCNASQTTNCWSRSLRRDSAAAAETETTRWLTLEKYRALLGIEENGALGEQSARPTLDWLRRRLKGPRSAIEKGEATQGCVG